MTRSTGGHIREDTADFAAWIARDHPWAGEVVARYVGATHLHPYELREMASARMRRIDNLGVANDAWPPQGHVS